MAGSVPLTPTGVTNAFGLAPAAAAALALSMATAATNHETFRELLVLQSDIERMLPLVVALNTGTNVGGVADEMGAPTNTFGQPSVFPLRPTGR